MAQSLNLTNYGNLNIVAQTTITADTAANASSAPVANSKDFDNGGPVLVGNIGAETAELLTASIPLSATVVPFSTNTTLPHNAGEAVTLLFGDQIKVYR